MLPDSGVLSERSEHEPEEYDPEAEFRDPDSDGLTIPRVSTDESEVPPELLKTFWLIVVVLNAAFLAIALGLMLIGFEGDLRRGGGLVAGGVVLFALAVRRYRNFRANEEIEEPDGAVADSPDGADSTADPGSPDGADSTAVPESSADADSTADAGSDPDR